MKDHMALSDRLAPLVICEEQPDWRLELLTALCTCLLVVFLYLMSNVVSLSEELTATASERDTWIARALADDPRPTVRVDRDGQRYTCRHFNVRHEWQAAVASECKVLAEMLRMGGVPQ